jgi:mono/diheme cytochrome c family protein
MKLKQRIFLCLKLVSFTALFSSCGTSFDLGDSTPQSLNVNKENPEWEADIQYLMQLKCMNCHANPKPKFAPTNTPKITLDQFAFFQNQYAERVRARVFHSKSNPMPPDYATPMSADEKAALKVYLARILGEDPLPDDSDLPASTTTTPTTGTTGASLSGSFVTNCAGCHGSKGQGGIGTNLQKSALSEAEFINVARNGKGGMTSKFTSSQISDDALKSDLKYLKSL